MPAAPLYPPPVCSGQMSRLSPAKKAFPAAAYVKNCVLSALYILEMLYLLSRSRLELSEGDFDEKLITAVFCQLLGPACGLM